MPSRQVVAGSNLVPRVHHAAVVLARLLSVFGGVAASRLRSTGAQRAGSAVSLVSAARVPVLAPAPRGGASSAADRLPSALPAPTQLRRPLPSGYPASFEGGCRAP